MGEGARPTDDVVLGVPASGASFSPLYCERKPVIYGVTEQELRTLAAWDALTAICASIASACLSLCGSIYLTASFTYPDAMSPEAKVLAKYVAPIAFVAALVFFAV